MTNNQYNLISLQFQN